MKKRIPECISFEPELHTVNIHRLPFIRSRAQAVLALTYSSINNQ